MKNKFPAAVEMPSQLWLNNELVASFMCSPYDLEDLAIGHLLTRRLIQDYSQVEEICLDPDSYQINVGTSLETGRDLFSVPKSILSGLSSIDKLENNYQIEKVNQDIHFPLEKIVSSSQNMVDGALIYKETGGVHAALIGQLDGPEFLREDIGRHCATDKAIGAWAKEGGEFSQSFIITTGRLSMDMILKAASMGIPLVASLKYPSDLGIKLAQNYGISLLAKILSDQPLIYTNKEKIILDKNKEELYDK